MIKQTLRSVCLLVGAILWHESTAYAQDWQDLRASIQANRLPEAKLLADRMLTDSLQCGLAEFWYWRATAYQHIAEDVRGTNRSLDSLAIFKADSAYHEALQRPAPSFLHDSTRAQRLRLSPLALDRALLITKQVQQTPKQQDSLRAVRMYSQIIAYTMLAHRLVHQPDSDVGFQAIAEAYTFQRDWIALDSLMQAWIDWIPIHYTRTRYRAQLPPTWIPMQLQRVYENWLGIYEQQSLPRVRRLTLLDAAIRALPEVEKFKTARLNLLFEDFNEGNTPDKAIKDLLAKIKEAPHEVKNYLAIATIYQKEQRDTEALEMYKYCLVLDPSHLEARFCIGGLYYNQGVKQLQSIGQMSFTDYQKNGKAAEEIANRTLAEALPYFEYLYAIQPDNVQIVKPLRHIYTRLKMYDKRAKLPLED